ncbi:MAG: hypothetical protein MUC85_03470 [Anaerolineales bacterium]|jgi:uncharacterized membrane protein YjfL (UPF0719 family)|nr:hypothetical protein [Anaerolineales bacterium]
MLISADLMRLFLLLTILGMAVLAAFRLRHRQLTLDEYLSWGLVAILIPLIGPYLVISIMPGCPTASDSIRN